MPSCARISCLERFHGFGVVVFFVVVTDQMQETMDRQMAEMMIERLLFVIGLLARRLIGDGDVAEHARRIVGAAGPVGCSAGNDSTLVGLSMPRQLLFSVRMPASSVSMTASSASPTSASTHLGRGGDGAMDHGFGVGLGLPALGDDENLGHGKDKGGIGPEFLLRPGSRPGARSAVDFRHQGLAGCRLLRQSFIGGDDPRHQFMADHVFGGEFHLRNAFDAIEQSCGFREARGLAVRQIDLARDRR